MVFQQHFVLVIILFDISYLLTQSKAETEIISLGIPSHYASTLSFHQVSKISSLSAYKRNVTLLTCFMYLLVLTVLYVVVV